MHAQGHFAARFASTDYAVDILVRILKMLLAKHELIEADELL